MAPSLTGTRLSLNEGKAALGNLQFKLIILLSQHAEGKLLVCNIWGS